MRLYGLLGGGKHVSVCKVCGKLESPGDAQFGGVWDFSHEHNFPGPAQLFVTCSTVKRGRTWYLFSCEHDVIRKW